MIILITGPDSGKTTIVKKYRNLNNYLKTNIFILANVSKIFNQFFYK